MSTEKLFRKKLYNFKNIKVVRYYEVQHKPPDILVQKYRKSL
jgi:hypothetical protein